MVSETRIARISQEYQGTFVVLHTFEASNGTPKHRLIERVRKNNTNPDEKML